MGARRINHHAIEKVLWVLEHLDNGRLVTPRIIEVLFNTNNAIKPRVSSVLLDDQKLCYGGEYSVQAYDTFTSIIANTYLCDYILCGKVPESIQSKSKGITDDILITYDLSVKTLKILDNIGVYSRSDLVKLSKQYPTKLELSGRLHETTGKSEKYFYDLVDELSKSGVLHSGFKSETTTSVINTELTKSSNNGDNQVKQNFSEEDKRKSAANTFNFLDKLIDSVSEHTTESLLYPNGFKEMHLCTTIDNYDVAANKLLESIKQEVEKGWKLWRVDEPEVYGSMIRIKYIMRSSKNVS